MKLAYQQLEQHLNKNIAPIYIVSSDELLLVQDTAELIRNAAYRAGYSERTLITVDSGTEWIKTFHTSTQSMSLFAAKQIIELNMHHTKFSANTTKALQEYAANPQQDIVLLIRTNKVDGKTEKSAWFQALEKKSVFISIWPISTVQLPQWIMQRAKKSGISLTKNTADLLAAQSEGNLLAAAQEIEKLYLLQLSGTDESSLNSALHADTDQAHFDVFDLVESVLAGNTSRSCRILRNLAAEDTEPTLILWALAREFRMLADMQTQIKQGATISSLFSKFHIFEKRQSSVRAFLQRHTLNSCWKLLLQAAQVDRIIKGAETGNIWDELERLVI